MSYDCTLVDPVTRKPLETATKHEITGGTYAVGGTQELWLNITFNYSKHIYKVLAGGIPGLDGKSGAESIPLLQKAISQLSDEVSDDYWEATQRKPYMDCWRWPSYGLMVYGRFSTDGQDF